MIEFIKAVLDGAYNFDSFVGKLGEFFVMLGNTVVYGDITLASIFTSAGLYSFILMGVGAILWMYGKKFLPLLKVIVFAGAGYVVGSVVLCPMLVPYIGESALLSPLTCGVVTALICAVLNKLIYNVLFFGIAAMFVYVITFAGGLIEGLPTIGNATLSYIAVGAVVFLLLIQKKNVERLGTAVLGSYFMLEGVTKNFFVLDTPIKIAVISAIGVLGLVYQYKRRKRYY